MDAGGGAGCGHDAIVPIKEALVPLNTGFAQMPMNIRRGWFVMAAMLCTTGVMADEYDPPAGYYDSATGTGATLKAQLTSIMSSGHIQRSYGDFRYSAVIHDADPALAGRILLVYNRASVSGTWNSGATWNREHVWPQSLQPGSASNSSRGNLGDPHALRPCNPSINSTRGNKPFAFATTFGIYGSQGSYYFPGDQDKGDIARCLFYSATRYSSSGLTLVNSFPSGNQMGQLDALIAWNYLDPPDEFERYRNHTIYSSALNPTYFTNNRNAYIDHPEFVWSVFGPGANDSTIYVGSSPAVNGSSSMTIDLGKAFVGGPLPADVLLDIAKDGADPTYYSVTPVGNAYSSITGRFNAFQDGPQIEPLTVGIDGDTNSVGEITGSIVIDNLDVSSGGTGQGSADGDDVVDVTFRVVRHALASLDPEIEMTSSGNMVYLAPLLANQVIEIPVYNLGYDADQALLDIDGVSGVSAPFSISGGVPVQMSTDAAVMIRFDASGFSSGSFQRTLTIQVSDEDLPGEQTGALVYALQVQLVGADGDWDENGSYDVIDQLAFDNCMHGPDDASTPPCEYSFDGDLDGDVDVRDFGHLQSLYIEF
jgi:endonuclease I